MHVIMYVIMYVIVYVIMYVMYVRSVYMDITIL